MDLIEIIPFNPMAIALFKSVQPNHFRKIKPLAFHCYTYIRLSATGYKKYNTAGNFDFYTAVEMGLIGNMRWAISFDMQTTQKHPLSPLWKCSISQILPGIVHKYIPPSFLKRLTVSRVLTMRSGLVESQGQTPLTAHAISRNSFLSWNRNMKYLRNTFHFKNLSWPRLFFPRKRLYYGRADIVLSLSLPSKSPPP